MILVPDTASRGVVDPTRRLWSRQGDRCNPGRAIAPGDGRSGSGRRRRSTRVGSTWSAARSRRPRRRARGWTGRRCSGPAGRPRGALAARAASRQGCSPREPAQPRGRFVGAGSSARGVNRSDRCGHPQQQGPQHDLCGPLRGVDSALASNRGISSSGAARRRHRNGIIVTPGWCRTDALSTSISITDARSRRTDADPRAAPPPSPAAERQHPAHTRPAAARPPGTASFPTGRARR